MTTETELACIKRDAQAGLADLGLSLAEARQLTAALRAGIVPTQVEDRLASRWTDAAP